MPELILFLIILSVLIISHEFGHFIVAKRSGMRVDEFGIGFPPRIFSYKGKETTYVLNLIPFGGYVKIYGEDGLSGKGDDRGEDTSRSFTSKPLFLQGLVIVAGVLFNFLFAWVLLSMGYMVGFPASATEGTSVTNPRVMITHIVENSPAYDSPLRLGDVMIGISSGGIRIAPKDADEAITAIQGAEGNTILLELERNTEQFSVELPLVEGIVQGKRAVGISIDTIGLLKLSPPHAFLRGLERTFEMILLTVTGIATLIGDAVTGEASLDAVAGPVGIYKLVGEASDLGIVYLLAFTAIISVSLGVINLVPFPALDGGRLLFLIIESIKGSPIRPGIANTINYVGFVVLIGLMLFISYFDLLKIGVL